eukprot:CAMPEP_0172454986 /NCGR_PEP_ID=MMETSP1065-20121228/11810_1 /TAXON_ID=265537 /ORGANISM="Amphiprora paludosa, Strain CCMP125" /LENGTH=675 /DNA_ID=CAMNT_0013207415 /DNA_START=59 /DNA_END=2086 /DNA_ORIENTATION=+
MAVGRNRRSSTSGNPVNGNNNSNSNVKSKGSSDIASVGAEQPKQPARRKNRWFGGGNNNNNNSNNNSNTNPTKHRGRPTTTTTTVMSSTSWHAAPRTASPTRTSSGKVQRRPREPSPDPRAQPSQPFHQYPSSPRGNKSPRGSGKPKLGSSMLMSSSSQQQQRVRRSMDTSQNHTTSSSVKPRSKSATGATPLETNATHRPQSPTSQTASLSSSSECPNSNGLLIMSPSPQVRRPRLGSLNSNTHGNNNNAPQQLLALDPLDGSSPKAHSPRSTTTTTTEDPHPASTNSTLPQQQQQPQRRRRGSTHRRKATSPTSRSSNERRSSLDNRKASSSEQHGNVIKVHVSRDSMELAKQLATVTVEKDQQIQALQSKLRQLEMEQRQATAAAAKSNMTTTSSAEAPPTATTTTTHNAPPSPILLLTQGQDRPQPTLYYLPGMRSLPFWTPQQEEPDVAKVAYQEASLTWAVQLMEQAYSTILDEYQKVAPHLPSDHTADPNSDHLPLQPGGTWDWHSYTQNGKVQEGFGQNFVHTTHYLLKMALKHLLLEQVAYSHTFFSTLHGHSRVGRHAAAANWRLRLCLPLLVPGNGHECGIRMGTAHHHSNNTTKNQNSHVRYWRPGRAVILDDSYLHEEWNDTDAPCVVLVVDLWHPDVARSERQELMERFAPHPKSQSTSDI